jgi:hypothetical protein
LNRANQANSFELLKISKVNMKRSLFYFVFIFIGMNIFSCREKASEPLAESSGLTDSSQHEYQEDFKVYHNPNQTKITVWHYSYDDIQGRLHIFSSDGRLLLQKDVTIEKRINTWELEIPKNAFGLLLVKLITPKIIRTFKIYKKDLV